MSNGVQITGRCVDVTLFVEVELGVGMEVEMGAKVGMEVGWRFG